MKSFIIVFVIAFLGVVSVNANPVPFAYTSTIEFAKVDSAMQKTLLTYANAGKYNSPVEIKADSILQTIMVKGVKSRSGNVEDQIWLQVQENGKVVNYLFSLSKLPVITSDPTTGKLTISAYRGDSDATNSPALSRNPW